MRKKKEFIFFLFINFIIQVQEASVSALLQFRDRLRNYSRYYVQILLHLEYFSRKFNFTRNIKE